MKQPPNQPIKQTPQKKKQKQIQTTNKKGVSNIYEMLALTKDLQVKGPFDVIKRTPL